MPQNNPQSDPASLWKPVQADDASAWKPVDTSGTQPGSAIPGTGSPSLTDTLRTTAEAGKKLDSNLKVGVARMLPENAADIGSMLYGAFPGALRGTAYGKDFAEGLDTMKGWANPQNTTQAIGKGLAGVGEFMLPGPAEEEAAAAIGKAAPKLLPFARAAISALSTGLVNKAQGGGFATGAAMGGAGSLAGEGLRAAAPKIAESAMHIGNTQRGFGKTPGRAMLDLTRGVRPETIASSGRESMASLMNDLESRVGAASERAAPHIAGFLMPPVRETPLGGTNEWLPRRVVNDVPGELIPAARLPQGNIVGEGTDMSPLGPEGRTRGVIGRPVEQLGSTSHTIPPRIMRESYVTAGTREPQDFEREPVGPGGVLLRRPEMSASIPPEVEAARIASLAPARGILANAQSEHVNAPTLYDQLGAMLDNLSTRQRGPQMGQAIPENVTPSDLLRLNRDFSEEHLGWNPNVHEQATHAGRGAYHANAEELKRVVPEARVPLQQVSSLIEVLRNADRESRMATLPQLVMHRLAAPTGALTGAFGGGLMGYREGGAKGAGIGALSGLVAGPLLSSPEGWAAIARAADAARDLRPAVGTALELTHGGGKR